MARKGNGRGKASKAKTKKTARKEKSTRKKMPFALRIRIQNREGGESSLTNKAKKKSTSTSWRHDAKENDPNKYKEVLHYGKLYSQEYRLKMSLAESTLRKRNLTPEEIEEAEKLLEKKTNYNDGCRIRQRRYAAKKKKKREEEKNKPKTPVTRKKANKKRECERNKKQKQRAAYSAERHEAVKARRRELYGQKREHVKDAILRGREEELQAAEERLRTMEETIKAKEKQLREKEQEIQANDVRSKPARRQSLTRALHALPRKTPQLVGTVVDLLNKASPTKQKAFKQAGVTMTKTALQQPNLQEVVAEGLSSRLKENKKNRKKRKILASTLVLMKKYRLQRRACKQFGISKKLLNKKILKQGRPNVNLETVKQVQEFYEVNSSQLPDKRLVSKKTGKPRHLLDRTIATLHQQYNKTYPDQQVCASVFYALRPKNVRTKRQAKYQGCLCEYCENLQLKLEVLANSKLRTVYHVANSTLCPKSTGSAFHKPACLERKCGNCGIHKLDDIFNDEELHHEVEWKNWKMVTNICHTKSNKTKEIKKRSLVTEKGTKGDLIQQLKEEATGIALHIFNKDWQHKQFTELKANLPEGAVLSIIDFSENYKCGFQREVQSAYYAQNSATLHPMVNYYKCKTCRELVQESCIVISNDLRHDYHLVNAMQAKVCKHLTEKRGLNIKVMYRYSDGCASQYKSKGPFSDMGYFKEDFGFPVIHSYFGSRHGKGPSDGEGAVIKSQASTAVLAGREVIADAKSLFEFSKKHLDREPEGDQCCKKFIRTSFFVSHGDVTRGRETTRHVQTVKGSRKLHCVMTVESGVIATRNLTCVCDGCLLGQGKCRNETHVDKWKTVDLRATNKQGRRASATAAQPPADQPPAAQPPVAKPPADQPPAAQPPVAKPPAAHPPAAKPPAAHPPAAKPPADSTSEREDKDHSGKYIVVSFQTKKSSRKYAGVIRECTPQDSKIAFMEKSKSCKDGQTFIFRNEPESWVPNSNIVRWLPTPSMDKRLRYVFPTPVDAE